MTRRRFYAPPEAFAPDGASLVLSGEESRHLRDVLRLRAGEGAAGELRLLFAERGGGALDSLSAEGGRGPAAVTALVGPEGGWDDEEVALARGSGWTVVTLGGRTLRAETAAVAVTAL